MSLQAAPKAAAGGGRYSAGWGTRHKADPKSAEAFRAEGSRYDAIKAQCQKEGKLFEDPDFPAVDTSVFYTHRPPKPFEWKRPKELVSDPQLFVGGASRFDIKQGELGDCWLLAALACVSQFPNLLHKVIPPGQSFNPAEGYAGIFRFNFWWFGKWVEVVVDDRLPTHNGKLVFLHSEEGNEFWTPLLEKAYAKLNGSYENLKGGSTSEALEDFSGGVTEIFDLTQGAPSNLFSIMMKAHERNSMMGCSVDQGGRATEAELPNGLIVGHAYSVTGIKLVDIKTARAQGKIQLIRARNPWGNECEWKGAWSDKSQEWQLINEEERKTLGLQFSDDGEFWMSYQDFITNFTKLELCNLGPDTMSDETSKKCFQMTAHEGCWKKRVNAGGCRNYLNTFWTNPQYRVTVIDADEGDDDNTGTLIVALLQKERRLKRKEGGDLLTIGYTVYPLKDPNCGPLDVNFFKYTASVAKAPAFINMREVCGRHKLPPGSYCIVPSTFEPNEEADFLLRVYSETVVQANELDEDTRIEYGEADGPEKRAAAVPPPTEEDTKTEKALREMFKKIAGEDLEVDAYELQGILNSAFMKEFKFEGFTADTCRSLVAMKDVDRSGKLGYEEFKKLWNDLRIWKTAFKNFDADNSGTFNSYELRQTLHSIGVRVSNATFNSLVQRYSHRDGKIYFDDYIHCIARLSTMFDIYKEMSQGGPKAQFTLDEFIATTMYS
jgi:calpain